MRIITGCVEFYYSCTVTVIRHGIDRYLRGCCSFSRYQNSILHLLKNSRIEKEKRYKGIMRILPLYFYFFFQTVLKFKNSKDG